MKKTERKFVEKSTCYAPPAMRFVVIATKEHILKVSGSDINDAGVEDDDIFGE